DQQFVRIRSTGDRVFEALNSQPLRVPLRVSDALAGIFGGFRIHSVPARQLFARSDQGRLDKLARVTGNKLDHIVPVVVRGLVLLTHEQDRTRIPALYRLVLSEPVGIHRQGHKSMTNASSLTSAVVTHDTAFPVATTFKSPFELP